jgi:4-amino-4-deoxy-L-arabinose transferase-like glycosyltransferase
MQHKSIGAAIYQQYVLLWLASLCVYLLSSAAILDNPDARSAYSMTRGLILRGDIAIQPQDQLDTMFEKVGRDGEVYSKYGLVQPLLQAPLFLAGYWLAPANELQATQAAVALLHAFTTATSLLVLYSIARILFASQRIALALALIYGFGTMAWLYATLNYTEPLLTLILLLICRLLLAADRHPSPAPALFIAAGGLTGLAILTRYPAVIYVPALLWYVWMITGHQRRHFAAFVAPLGLGVLALAGYNLWRYEDIFNTGYHIKELTRFPRPPWYGLYTLFFSPGKSVFVYAPPLLPAVLALPVFMRRTGTFGKLVIALLLSSVLFYGIVRPWSGAWSPGPRYQLPVLPLALLALGVLFAGWADLAIWKRAGILSLVALGAMIQLPLISSSYNDTLVVLQVITGGGYAWGFWFFNPDYMPLLWQIRMFASALSRATGGPSLLPAPLPPSIDRPGQPIDQIACWFAHVPPGSHWALLAAGLAGVAAICLVLLLFHSVRFLDRSTMSQLRRKDHAKMDVPRS